MPKQKKTCRVCGASYEACRSVRTGDNTFNWREVACSPECGMVYLERITASRNKVEDVVESKPKKCSAKKHQVAKELPSEAPCDFVSVEPVDIKDTEIEK